MEYSTVRAPRSREFACKKCKKCYTYARGLNQHLKYECGKEKLFECNICHQKFHQKSNLKSHLMRHTMKNKKPADPFTSTNFN